MTAPRILRVVLQRERHCDCAIAGLASLLGRSYEHVLIAAARSVKGDFLKNGGLDDDDMIRVAKALGARLRAVPWDKVDEDEAVGLLEIQGRFNGEKYEHHLALFMDGKVIDLRDGNAWPLLDAFLVHYAVDVPTCLWVSS